MVTVVAAVDLPKVSLDQVENPRVLGDSYTPTCDRHDLMCSIDIDYSVRLLPSRVTSSTEQQWLDTLVTYSLLAVAGLVCAQPSRLPKRART